MIYKILIFIINLKQECKQNLVRNISYNINLLSLHIIKLALSIKRGVLYKYPLLFCGWIQV